MAEDIQKLLNQAQAAGWVFQGVEDDPNTGTPKIKAYWNTKPDPNIMARLKANKPAIVAQLRPTPTKDRARDAKTASLPWLGRLNKTINEKIEPNPKTHPWLHALYPTSATGKALMAVPTAVTAAVGGPEEVGIGGAAALGAETAGITGALSGEIKNKWDALESMATGAISTGLPTALGELPGAVNLLRHKADIVADLDAKAQGEFVTKALGLGRLSKSISRGRNWISAIKSRFVGNEAWDRMSGEMDGVGQDLQTKVQDQIDQLKQAFQQKYGVGQNMTAFKGQLKANKQMLQDFQQLKEQVSTLESIPNKYRQSLSALKRLRPQAYKPSGEFRATGGAIGAVENLEDTMNGLKAILSGDTKDLPFNDPSLLQRFEEARKGYQQFAGFRDLARNAKLLTEGSTGTGNLSSGKVNTAVMQKILRDHPSNYETKLGDLWDDFQHIVRRGEVDTDRIDVQGNVPTMKNISAHMSQFGKTTGFVRGIIPRRGAYIGQTPRLLGADIARDASGKALVKAPPALVVGGATAGANAGEGIGLLGPDEVKNAQ